MTLSWFLSMVGFMWVTAITPGPNNLLLTASGANFGVKRSLFVMLGIILGMQTIVWLSIAGIGGLLLTFPILHNILTLLGSIYMLWLAWKITTARYQPLPSEITTNKPLPAYQTWLLQFLNPKAWLMGLGAVATYSLPGSDYLKAVVIISLSVLVINIIAGLIWLIFGSLVGRLLRHRKTWYAFNYTMGILTALCVVFIWI